MLKNTRQGAAFLLSSPLKTEFFERTSEMKYSNVRSTAAHTLQIGALSETEKLDVKRSAFIVVIWIKLLKTN